MKGIAAGLKKGSGCVKSQT